MRRRRRDKCRRTRTATIQTIQRCIAFRASRLVTTQRDGNATGLYPHPLPLPHHQGALGILTEHVSAVNASGYHASDVLVVREVLPGLPLWTLNHPLMPGDVLLEVDGQALTRCSDAEALAVLRRSARNAARDHGAVTLTLRRAPEAIRGDTLFRPIFPSAAGRLRRKTAVGLASRSHLAP